MDTDIKSFFTDHQRWEMNNYSLDQCREAIHLLQARIKQLTNEDYQSWLQKQVKDLGLSKRAYNSLISAKIRTVEDLLKFGLNRINMIRGSGEQTAEEIKQTVLRDMPDA